MTSLITSLANADILKHYGMCDASAAVPVSASLFAVANDEDNSLRIYKNDQSGQAVYSKDMTTFLNLEEKHPEADIEGATLIGQRIYWITSHGANKEGKKRPNRRRFFATDIEITGDSVSLKPVGTAFSGLIEAIEASKHFQDLNLADAAKKAPESKGGLNIEGLTRTPTGQLLIGFRNAGTDHALLIALDNPQAVIEGKEQPKLDKPILLDLAGRGIRSIEYSEAANAYFIIAGSYDDTDDFQLYQWSGKADEAAKLINVDFQDLRPEALIVYPDQKNHLQILSDDGSQKVKGVACKDLENAQDKSFRSVWLNL